MSFFSKWLNNFTNKTKYEQINDTISSNIENAIYYQTLAKTIATNYIANTISKCEFKVFENGESVKNKLYYTLNYSPTPNENSSQWINKLITNLCNNGEALIVQDKNKKHLFVADSYTITKNTITGNTYSNILVDNCIFDRIIESEDILFFKLDNKSIDSYLSAITDVYSRIFVSTINSFRLSNGQKYKLVRDMLPVGTPEDKEKAEEQLKKNIRKFIENENSIFVQSKGINLQTFEDRAKVSVDSVINIRKEIFDITAQAYKIPLPMMYGNITNMQEIVKVFLTFCIDPIADMIEEELTRKFYPFIYWNKGKNYIQIDTSTVNHIDVLDVADKADKLIASGTLCIDEVRNVIDYPAIGGNIGTKHYVTKNYADIETTLKGGE